MAFGVGMRDTKLPDEGELAWKQEPVACDCWFSSKGETIPRLIRYQMPDMSIRTIRDITIHCALKKRYCGIPMMVYLCSAQDEEQRYEFKLIFHLEECCWKIIWDGIIRRIY